MLDFGRILIGKASKSALRLAGRPAEGPMLKLSRLESGRNPARKPDFTFPAWKHHCITKDSSAIPNSERQFQLCRAPTSSGPSPAQTPARDTLTPMTENPTFEARAGGTGTGTPRPGPAGGCGTGTSGRPGPARGYRYRCRRRAEIRDSRRQDPAGHSAQLRLLGSRVYQRHRNCRIQLG